MTLSREQLRWAAVIVVLAAVQIGRFVHRLPFDFGDEGYLHYIAWRIRAGDLPYRDIELFSYVPGLFYAVAALVEGAADPIGRLRWVFVGLFAANAALVFLLGARMGAPRAAALAALVVVLVPGPWHFNFVATLNLLLLAAAFAAVSDAAGRRWFAALGVLIGLGLWLRIDFAAVAVAMAALCALLIPRRAAESRMAAVAKSIGIAAGAAGLTIAPMLLLLASAGVLDDYIRQIAGFLPFALDRSTAWHKMRVPAPTALVQWTAEGAFAWLYYASLLVPGLLLLEFLHAWRGRPRGRGITPGLALRLVMLLWLAGNLPQYVLERPDIAHMAHRAPALLLGGIWLLALLPRVMQRRVLAGAAALFLGGYAAYAYGLWYIGLPWWITGSPRMQSVPTREVVLRNGMRFVKHEHMRWPELLDRILEQSSPGERVASLPFIPGLNFLLLRAMPGRQVFLVPHSLARANAEGEYIAALEQTRTRFVLYWENFRINNQDETLFPRYAPALSQYLRGSYREVGRQELFVLLERSAPWSSEGGSSR